MNFNKLLFILVSLYKNRLLPTRKNGEKTLFRFFLRGEHRLILATPQAVELMIIIYRSLKDVHTQFIRVLHAYFHILN